MYAVQESGRKSITLKNIIKEKWYKKLKGRMEWKSIKCQVNNNLSLKNKK